MKEACVLSNDFLKRHLMLMSKDSDNIKNDLYKIEPHLSNYIDATASEVVSSLVNSRANIERDASVIEEIIAKSIRNIALAVYESMKLFLQSTEDIPEVVSPSLTYNKDKLEAYKQGILSSAYESTLSVETTEAAEQRKMVVNDINNVTKVIRKRL